MRFENTSGHPVFHHDKNTCAEINTISLQPFFVMSRRSVV